MKTTAPAVYPKYEIGAKLSIDIDDKKVEGEVIELLAPGKYLIRLDLIDGLYDVEFQLEPTLQ